MGNHIFKLSTPSGLVLKTKDKYVAENIEIKLDATTLENLTAENIKEGSEILGITGTFAGVVTDDATAVAADIRLNKTAYVKGGNKITGTMPDSTLTGSTSYPLSHTPIISVSTTTGDYIIPNTLVSGTNTATDSSYRFIKVSSDTARTISNSGTLTQTAGYSSGFTKTINADLTLGQGNLFVGIKLAGALANKGLTGSSEITVSDTATNGFYSATLSNLIFKTAPATAGYITTDEKTISITSAVNIGKIKAGSVSSSISGTNPTVTPSISVSGTKANYGITQTKPTSGTDGANYITFTPGGSSSTETHTANMSLTAGYIATKETEGTKSVSATVSGGKAEYIPVVSPVFDGGALTPDVTYNNAQTNATLEGTDNSGIAISVTPTASYEDVLYNGAKKGLVNIADNTVALSGKSETGSAKTKYLKDITIIEGKTLNSVTNTKGTITTVANNGTISTLSGTGTISKHSGTTTITKNAGRINVSGSETGGSVYIGNTQVANASGLITGSVNTPATTVTVATSNISMSETGKVSGSATKDVTPNVSKAGWITSGTKGTITANFEYDLPSATFSVSGSSVTCTTAGFVPAGSVGDISIADGAIGSFAKGDSISGYTENTTFTGVPSGGYLKLTAGYYPNTVIALDTILGGKGDASTITADYILADYAAYDVDGNLINGVMASWNNPSTTYFTTSTSDAYDTTNAVVPAKTYNKSTSNLYIKKASGWSSSGSVTTAPSVTITKDINSNIATSTTDTYGTGFKISDSVSEGNGTVQTKYSITTAGWTPTKSNVSSGTVTVDPAVSNNFGTNYITKLTIPAGKSFGKFTSSSDYADGVTIGGSSGNIGKLYTGFSTSGYGELYLRDAGSNGYTKVADAGKLITTSRSDESSSVEGGSNVTLTTTNNGISVTGKGTVKTGTGWVTGGSTTTSGQTKYISGVNVPKDTAFSITMTKDDAADTTSNLTITNAGYRTISINGGGDKGVLVNGAKGKTVTVDTKVVTDANGDLKVATPGFDGGEITSEAKIASSQTNATLSSTDITSGIKITATSDATSADVLYNGAVDGWVTKSDNAQVLAGKTSATTAKSADMYLTDITVASGKTLNSVTNNGTIKSLLGTGTITNLGSSSTSATLTITNINSSKVYIGGSSGDKTVQVSGKVTTVDGTTVTNSSGDLITTTISGSGGGLSSSTGYENTPTVTVSSGSDTNMDTTNSIVAIGAKDTTNYPYYFKVSGSTAKLSGTTSVKWNGATYTNTAGWLSANTDKTLVSGGEANPAVTINSGSGSNYIKLKKATFTSSNGTATLTVKENQSAISGAMNIHSAMSDSSKTISTKKPTSGYFYAFDVSSSGTGSVSTNGAGYIPGSEKVGEVTVSKGATTYYTQVSAATGSITNGTATSAKAKPSVTGSLKNLSATSGSGVSSSKPSTGTDGTNYWTITPDLASTTNGSVSAATATITSAGYVGTGTLASGSSVSVSVTKESGTSYYINKASGETSISANSSFTPTVIKDTTKSTNNNAVNITSSDTGTVTTSNPTSGYYIAVKTNSDTAKTITATSKITSAGYTPANNSFSTAQSTVELKESALTYIPINAAEFSSGSGGTVGLTVKENQSTISGATNIHSIASDSSKTISTTKPTSGYFYAFDVSASGGSAAVTTTKAGYVPSGTNVGTINVGGKDSTTYYATISSHSGENEAVTGTASYDSLVGLTVSTSNKASGITFRPKASGLSKRYKVTSMGIIPTGTYGATDGSLEGSTNYVTDVAIPASKTLNSVTLTSGTSTNRTYLTELNINSLSTVSTMSLSGIVENVSGSGYLKIASSSTLGRLYNDGTISNLIGTGTITNAGISSTETATLTITTNTYGTVNIWNAGGNKGVQVKDHTVKVDGTTVTDRFGDLFLANPVFDGGDITSNASLSASQTNATLSSKNTSGIAIKATSNASSTAVLYNGTSDGWLTKADNAQALAAKTAATTKNSDTKYLTDLTVASGKRLNSVTNNGTITNVEQKGTMTVNATGSSYTKYNNWHISVDPTSGNLVIAPSVN